MKIKKIEIKKFRGFREVEFELGHHLTIIAGQNGTQKTTILGLLSQPFTITDKKHPMYGEKPLNGGEFKSAFSDKFKLSKVFDKKGEHEWTLYFDDIEPYTVESIYRDKKIGDIRFWKKGTKKKGSGYIQFPVIYLSLRRLLPIGEDVKLKEDPQIVLSIEEQEFYTKWHNKILILTRESDQAKSSTTLSSVDKQTTLGANTDYYNWESNSAGQDNIGKILLAILSFRRLKKNHKANYKGGILAIDEVDTAFYSGSQIKLLEALNKFSSDFDIQIIFTTHSLTMLEKASSLNSNKGREGEINLIFLKKEGGQVKIKSNVNYDFIRNDLNVTLSNDNNVRKIDVYTEDAECAILVKSLLGNMHTKHLNFINVSLGCNNLIELVSKKIPCFSYPKAIIFLDGDVRIQSKAYKKVKKLTNIILLPTEEPPEKIIANFLNNLKDNDKIWKSVDNHFSHEYCFQDYSLTEINTYRGKAKKWFVSHLPKWGRNASKILNPWKKEHKEEVEIFKNEFVELYRKISANNKL